MPNRATAIRINATKRWGVRDTVNTASSVIAGVRLRLAQPRAGLQFEAAADQGSVDTGKVTGTAGPQAHGVRRTDLASVSLKVI
jgi:hypothetical protein